MDKIQIKFDCKVSDFLSVVIIVYLYPRSLKGEGGILFYLCSGSRNLTGPKTLPTIWYTYMMLVTKYQISAINSY
jgi:hypothetical protein